MSGPFAAEELVGASIVALVEVMGRTEKTAKSEKKDVEGGVWRRAGGLTQAEGEIYSFSSLMIIYVSMGHQALCH